MSIDTEVYHYRTNLSKPDIARLIDYLYPSGFTIEFHRFVTTNHGLISKVNKEMIETSGVPAECVSQSDFDKHLRFLNVREPFDETQDSFSHDRFGVYYDLKGKSGAEIIEIGFGVARIKHTDFNYDPPDSFTDYSPIFGYIWNADWRYVDLSEKYEVGVFDVGKKLKQLSEREYPLMYPERLQKVFEADTFYAQQLVEGLTKFIWELTKEK